MQDTLIIDTSNAHCGPGSIPGPRLSEGRYSYLSDLYPSRGVEDRGWRFAGNPPRGAAFVFLNADFGLGFHGRNRQSRHGVGSSRGFVTALPLASVSPFPVAPSCLPIPVRLRASGFHVARGVVAPGLVWLARPDVLYRPSFEGGGGVSRTGRGLDWRVPRLPVGLPLRLPASARLSYSAALRSAFPPRPPESEERLNRAGRFGLRREGAELSRSYRFGPSFRCRPKSSFCVSPGPKKLCLARPHLSGRGGTHSTPFERDLRSDETTR